MLLRKKEEIEAWLNQYKITNYELIEDKEYGYVVNVNKSVDLCNKDLKSIDVKFNNINGCFDCSVNQLNSLEGSPVIVNGYFDCSLNQLKSLEGSPKIVNRNFFCSINQLKSLDGSPEIIKGDFECNNNELVSLEGGPKEVGNDYNCNHNKLITLKGCPNIINGSFCCSHNLLTSLEFIGKTITNYCLLGCNKLEIKELKYLPDIVKSNYIDIENNRKLKDYQKINNFNELKEKITIHFEKENLLNSINKEELNKKNNINKI